MNCVLFAVIFASSPWSEAHSPNHFVNLGRSEFLAGRLPLAIRAFRDGLALAPWNAELQEGLIFCRSKVDYPPDDRLRPEPLTTMRYRLSPWDLLVLSGLSSFCLVVGLSLRFTRRSRGMIGLTILGGIGVIFVFLAIGKLELSAERDRAKPMRVLLEPGLLRTGNGAAYKERLPYPIPAGAEVRERHRRGGWVQVEFHSGVVGWLPEGLLR